MLTKSSAVLLAAFVLAATLVLGSAAPAHAHASVVSTDPGEGAVLATAPERVVIAFSESVTSVPDGVQVFDAAGSALASFADVSGDQLEVRFDEALGEGTVVVVWRIVSEDGHPVSGSLSFSVGAPSAEVVRPAAAGAGTPDAPVLLSLARLVGYVGLFLATGLIGFALLLLPPGAETERPRRRLVRLARAGALTTAVAWALAVPLVATYQVGGGLGALGDGRTWSAVPTTEYAVAAAVVVGVVGAAAAFGAGAPSGWRAGSALLLSGLALAAPALTGHTRAATPEALAVAAQVLHLLAGSTWVGGVVALAVVLRDLAERGTVASDVLARFSAVAAGVLVALVATGALLSWRIVGSWTALVDSAYGRLLLLKVLTVMIAVGIAAWNRRVLVPRMDQAHRRRERRAGAALLVRTTSVEASLLAVVLALTGFLVDRSPDDVGSSVASPSVATAMLGPYQVQATLSPLQPGPTTLTLFTSDFAGEPFEGMEAPRARLSSAGVDLGSLPLRSTAPGTYAADVVLPSPGTWEVQFSLRTTEFENPVTTLRFEVRDGAVPQAQGADVGAAVASRAAVSPIVRT